MLKKTEIEKKCEEFVQTNVDAHQFELVDVEFVKEGSNYYLRVFADKEGGINIDLRILFSILFFVSLKPAQISSFGLVAGVTLNGLVVNPYFSKLLIIISFFEYIHLYIALGICKYTLCYLD